MLMGMSTNLSQQFPQVGAFLEAIEPMLPAYRYGLLSYVAVVHEGEAVILRAGLRFSVDAPPLPRRINQPLSLRAGQRRFDNLELSIQSIETWIRAAVSEHRLPSDDPLLKLLPEQSRRFSAYHESNPQCHVGAPEDPERVQISGAGREFISTRHRVLERELNEVGFDTFNDLMRTFGLDPSEQTSFEISVAPVAKIDSASQLCGTQLQLVVHVARGLEREKLRITVRDADSSRARIPRSFISTELDWTERDGYWIGSFSFNLDANAVVICRAVYAGRIQHEVRLADPHALPNPRRMLMHVFDPGLMRIQKVLTNPIGKAELGDFEPSVPLLFQMLGFPPAPIGRLSLMQGEPDIFLEGADGEMLVVECSTDVPSDDKFMKLVSRVERAREELSRLASPPIVLPVLVVPVLPAELDPIREKASKYGVLILSLPEIKTAMARTEFAPDARQVLREWRTLSHTRVLMHGLDGRQ